MLVWQVRTETRIDKFLEYNMIKLKVGVSEQGL
jgi:hypothetical protein